jgi:hypothetical protein
MTHVAPGTGSRRQAGGRGEGERRRDEAEALLDHHIEGALQASGRAGARQVPDVNVSFVGASAPIVTGTTFIFVREPY